MRTRRRRRAPNNSSKVRALPKTPTGIAGFDEVTGGGLPRGRPTLICGGPGCGKTLFGLEFLIHGAANGEPGVFVTFEETADDLTANVSSLGYDLADLTRRKRFAVEYVRVERSEIEETGEYDLEALFIRLDHALRSIGARRIVIDTIEALFAGLTNIGVLRAEIRRLFAWLKERNITAVITGERGVATLTRQGLEEYVSDCVIVLDHRVVDQISTRRLRVVKYRGSSHGTNEYPFLIDRRGVAILPITSLQLGHTVSSERISTGMSWLDGMFGGRGYFRTSSIMISGGAGTAKTSLAAHFLNETCRRGELAMCFQFEESPAQYVRNMGSIGLDLGRWTKNGRLLIHAARPTLHGLEAHLTAMHRDIEERKPSVVVIDPLSSFTGGTAGEVNNMLMRLIDFLKGQNITALFTHLMAAEGFASNTDFGVSSLMDTWIVLKNTPGDRHGRRLTILKSRGMAHSDDTQAFALTDRGATIDRSAIAARRVRQ